MKQKKLWVEFLFSVLFSLALSANQQAAGSQPGAITVGGLGEVQAVPDSVSLTLGIEARERELAKALSLADECVVKVIDIAMKAGVDKQDIQTDRISIDPSYSGSGQKREIQFFVVRRNVSLVLKKIERYDQLVKDCVEAGINRVSNVQFQIADRDKLREQAREKAVKAAIAKAKTFADGLGLKIGKAVAVVEGGAGQSRQGYDPYIIMAMAPGIQADRVNMAGSGSDWNIDGVGVGSLALGRIAVSASVIIRFELL